MKKAFVFSGIMLLGCMSIAYGSSWNCGGGIVGTGDSKMDVISKCGSPDYSETVSQDTSGYIGGGGVSLSTKKVDKLYYSARGGSLSRVVTFTDGKVVKIETGSR